MNIKIGQVVTFKAAEVNFRGVVCDLRNEFAYIAVLGYPHLFCISRERVHPATTEVFAEI